MLWLASASAAAALWWSFAPQVRLPLAPEPARVASREGLLHRYRLVWSLLGGVAAWSFLSGPVGVAGGVALAIVLWGVIGRTESPYDRRLRRAAEADLPHLVLLLALALRSGAAPAGAVQGVVAALPGPAADRLAVVGARLAVGRDPATAWTSLIADPVLAPLGRCLTAAGRSGAPVSEAVESLAQELLALGAADAEDRARRVGVQAALPLGLCLLPAFLLLGVVPVVAGLFGTLLA